VGIWVIVYVQKPSHHFLQTFLPLPMFKIVFRDSSLFPKQLHTLRLLRASAELALITQSICKPNFPTCVCVLCKVFTPTCNALDFKHVSQ